MARTLAAATRRVLGSRRRGDRAASVLSADSTDAALVDDLVEAIGADRVRADTAARYLASRDASIYREGNAGPVCYPGSTDDVVACVQVAARHGRAVSPRGAGTGLAGGAAPLGQPVVLSMTRMDKLLEVDLDNGVAWVQPGMVNLDLSRALAPHGVHYAPDPSSQAACTIGGNVANNSGGPHCLAYGVTSAHVVAVEVVLSDASVVTLGGLTAEPAGYDLRGAFVGSEGMCGIATAVAVRLTPNPPAVRTMLLCFDDVSDGAATVSAIIGPQPDRPAAPARRQSDDGWRRSAAGLQASAARRSARAPADEAATCRPPRCAPARATRPTRASTEVGATSPRVRSLRPTAARRPSRTTRRRG